MTPRFPPPKIFTNALLGGHEITTLIRDTEPHERALFSLDPNTRVSSSRSGEVNASGHGRKSIYPTGTMPKQSAVARVLGNEMLNEIRQSSGSAARGRGGVNVEVLLRGAERLCTAYSVEGASDKIAAIRRRHQHISASITDYQERVMNQQNKMDRYQSGSGYGVDENAKAVADKQINGNSLPAYAEDDLALEEAEIAELEAKKRALEARVAGIEKDLGGLLA